MGTASTTPKNAAVGSEALPKVANGHPGKKLEKHHQREFKLHPGFMRFSLSEFWGSDRDKFNLQGNHSWQQLKIRADVSCQIASDCLTESWQKLLYHTGRKNRRRKRSGFGHEIASKPVRSRGLWWLLFPPLVLCGCIPIAVEKTGRATESKWFTEPVTSL